MEKAFSEMAKDLVGDPDRHAFQYRDFQARNVMLDRDGQPRFIDFQGGRRGPVEYDVASFLWQASAHYAPELRHELMATYLDAARLYTDVDEDGSVNACGCSSCSARCRCWGHTVSGGTSSGRSIS